MMSSSKKPSYSKAVGVLLIVAIIVLVGWYMMVPHVSASGARFIPEVVVEYWDGSNETYSPQALVTPLTVLHEGKIVGAIYVKWKVTAIVTGNINGTVSYDYIGYATSENTDLNPRRSHVDQASLGTQIQLFIIPNTMESEMQTLGNGDHTIFLGVVGKATAVEPGRGVTLTNDFDVNVQVVVTVAPDILTLTIVPEGPIILYW